MAKNANQLFGSGRTQQAVPIGLQAIASAEQSMGRNHPSIAQLHNLLSTIFQSLKAWDKAMNHAERSLECARGFADPDHIRVLQAGNSKALCLLNLDDHEQAETLYREVVAGFDKIGDVEGLVQAKLGLGSLLDLQGRYAEAESFLLGAVEAQRSIAERDLRGWSQSLSTLGSFYAGLGDDDRARHYQEEALSAGRQAWGAEHPMLLDRLTGLARTLGHLRQYDQAATHIDEARKIVTAAGGAGSPRIVSVNMAEAVMAADSGNFARAAELISQSNEILRGAYGPDFPGHERLLNNLGFLAMIQGDLDGAEKKLSEALLIMERSSGENTEIAANTATSLAMAAALRGEPDAAVTWLLDGNQRYEAVLHAVKALGSGSQKLAFLHQLSGKTNFALTLHQEMFPNHAGAREAALLTILQRKGRAADLTARSTDLDHDDPRKDRRQLLLREIAGIALGKTQLPPGTAKEKAWALQQELEALERELRLEDPQDLANYTEVSIEAIRQSLTEGEALVEYVVYRPTRPEIPKAKLDSIPLRCSAYVLRNGGEILSVDLGELEPIAAAVQKLLAAVSRPGSENFREAARHLDLLAFESVRKMVGQEIQRWRISPDGALNLVPFGTLVDESGKFLIETHELTYLSSGRDLLRRSTGSGMPTGNVTLVAAPDFAANSVANSNGAVSSSERSAAFGSMQFTPLPGTLAEAKALYQMMPNADFLLGAEATETTVKSLQNPLLLHVATHGFFLSNEPSFAGARGLKRKQRRPSPSQTVGPTRPSFFTMESPLTRSGLALAGANHLKSGVDDGVLTALEVTGLNLRGTRLVVLSACETGVGEVVSGEGVYGLRRAFLLAGAEAQVLSLWKVHDDATRVLMERFYTEMKAGDSRSGSLRKAQLSLMQEGRYQHPAYWAAFILSGATSPLSGNASDN